MRGPTLLLAACLATVSARAQAPHITLHVEQPAIAGLPIWLDVAADDPCIGVHYHGDLDGTVRGGHADIMAPGQKPAAPGFKAISYPHRGLERYPAECPSDSPPDRGTQRMPLHLIANLRQPGQYAVRWIVPTTEKLGAIAPTPWVTFTVQPSTAARRESWFSATLAHIPTDNDTLAQTYLPGLLAAAGDPRVTRRLLDLLCLPDRAGSRFVFQALPPGLTPDAQSYLARLIAQGCLGDGLTVYLNTSIAMGQMHGGFPEPQRRRLLKAILTALPHASGAGLAHAITMMFSLKGGRISPPSAAHPDILANAVDAAVLRMVPTILASNDKPGNSADQPKWALIEYVSGARDIPASGAVLRSLAAQNDPAAGYALAKMLYSGDPANLAFLRERLSSPVPDFTFPDPTDSFKDIPQRFGAPGTALLHALLQAASPHVRATAAVALASAGDHDGINAVLTTLRADRAPDTAQIINRLTGEASCQDEDMSCHQIITASTNPQSSWIAERKAAIIDYFENRLRDGH